MTQPSETGTRPDATPVSDQEPGPRWLEAAARTMFPPECAVAVQRYDPPGFIPHPDDSAAVSSAVEKRRWEFTAGRAAARAALEELGVPASFIGIGPDRNPLWPEGLGGSITHTNGLALAVVARRARIAALGIDLESSDAVKADLWRVILTPAEIGWIRGWPGDRHVEWATLIFCAKECFFKLQHPLTGQWVDFLEAEVSLVPGQSEFSLACTKSAATDLLGRARFTGRYAGGYGLTLAAMHLPAVGA